MFIRFISYIIGIILSSISLSFIIIYSNLLNFGYNFLEYVKFISSKAEVLLLFLGMFLIGFGYRRKVKI